MERVGVSQQFILLEYSVGGSGQFVLSMGLLNDRKISLYGAKNIKGEEGVYFNELQLLVESLIKEAFEAEKINTHRFNKAIVVVDKKGCVSLRVRDIKGIEKDVALSNNLLIKDIQGLVASILGHEVKKKESVYREKKSIEEAKKVISNKAFVKDKFFSKQMPLETLHIEKAKAASTSESCKKSDKADSSKNEGRRQAKKERILKRIIKEEIVDELIEDKLIKRKEKIKRQS
jgi:hypothetical protein